MLNAFPSLLTYGLLAPFIIRLTLGLLFLMAGLVKTLKNREECVSIFSNAGFPSPKIISVTVGLVEVAIGVCLIVGLGTQIAAIAAIIISGLFMYIKIRQPNLLQSSMQYYLLIIVMAISLMLTGAGFLAFDLPL